MNDNEKPPALDYKTRAVIDDFNAWFIEGATMRDVGKRIMRRHNITFMQLRQIFKDELNVDIGNQKEFFKKVFKKKQGPALIASHIQHGKEKIQ